jgi:hypothetical protein
MLFCEALQSPDNIRMDDLLQLFPQMWMCKDLLSKGSAIDFPIRTQDRPAEAAHNFLVGGVAFPDAPVGQIIRTNDGYSSFGQQSHDGAFAAGDAAGDAQD